jgi:N-acetylglutamate synthase-like GNAT family acetyltransferase
MSFEWIHENPPHWDSNKAAIVGGAPEGIFDIGGYEEAQVIPGEWWRVESDGAVVGYGWMDCTWGDAEILLAVAPSGQKHGAGSFILDHLEREAAERGLNYLYNVVRPTHPDGPGVTKWLVARGFEPSRGDRLVRHVKRG